MLDLANLGILTSGALGDLQKMVGKYFKDERMQQSLSFQTLYLGLSPYESLAIYSLLPYVEIAGGIFYPMGGMFQLALALERLARELGVTFRYGARVQRFETAGDQVRSALLADGTRVTADIVVANADLPYTYDELLQAPVSRHRAEALQLLRGAHVHRHQSHVAPPAAPQLRRGPGHEDGMRRPLRAASHARGSAVLRRGDVAHRPEPGTTRGREPLRAGAGAEPAGGSGAVGRLERRGTAGGAADTRPHGDDARHDRPPGAHRHQPAGDAGGFSRGVRQQARAKPSGSRTISCRSATSARTTGTPP